MNQIQLRQTCVKVVVAKSNIAFLQRITDRQNNFDDDLIKSAILELKSRKVFV